MSIKASFIEKVRKQSVKGIGILKLDWEQLFSTQLTNENIIFAGVSKVLQNVIVITSSFQTLG